MRKMAEFMLDLNGTPEEREYIKSNPGKPFAITFTLDLPAGSTIRRVNTRILQHERTVIHPQTKEIVKAMVPEEVVYIWAETDDNFGSKKETFKIIQTGCEIPFADYVGTFLLQAGATVCHIYGPLPT